MFIFTLLTLNKIGMFLTDSQLEELKLQNCLLCQVKLLHLNWKPTKVGMVPFYCTDFCSALHQEMSGYIRVSPAGSNVPISYSLGTNLPASSTK
jgi:hypothetical protein